MRKKAYLKDLQNIFHMYYTEKNEKELIYPQITKALWINYY